MQHTSILKIVLPAIALAVALCTASAQPSPAADGLGLPGAGSWTFVPGSEFPGARGTLSFKTQDGMPTQVLQYNFTEGGLYVGARTRVDIPAGAVEIRVRIKSDEGGPVSLRLLDADDRTFPIMSSYVQAGEWQTLRFSLEGAKPFGGGAATIRFPIKALSLLVHKKDRNELAGELSFTGFEIIK